MKHPNSSGIILIVVLWLLVILSVLVVGLSQRSGLELAVTKYRTGKITSKYAAIAGFEYALNQIWLKNQDRNSSSSDMLFALGVRLDKDQSVEDIFKHIETSSGYFDVAYRVPGSKGRVKRFGLADEDGKINLNGLSVKTRGVLKALIAMLGFDEAVAEKVASSVIDWRDEDTVMLEDPRQDENDYYMDLRHPYLCKNKPFDIVDELLLVRGVTPEIFKKIKPFVTVYPAQGQLMINLDTAPAPVLSAFAKNFSGSVTNAGVEDAESLVEKIMTYRDGDDHLEGNATLSTRSSAFKYSSQNTFART